MLIFSSILATSSLSLFRCSGLQHSSHAASLPQHVENNSSIKQEKTNTVTVKQVQATVLPG